MRVNTPTQVQLTSEGLSSQAVKSLSFLPARYSSGFLGMEDRLVS
jgi:hypothetical protein